MAHSDSQSEAGDFRNTRWSLVLRAVQSNSEDGAEALAGLCEIYWRPVYVFICRQGYPASDAEDLTQDFFTRLIEREFINVADQEKGRFRCFLLACVKHFLSNEKARQQAIKRGGRVKFISLDDERNCEAIPGPTGALSPEESYDHGWAVALLQQALNRLRSEYTHSSKESQFIALEPFLSGSREAQKSHAALGAELGVSEEAARKTVSRFRERFGELLRSTLAETVGGPRELEAELNSLRSVLVKAHLQ